MPILGVALLIGWAGLHALLFCVAVPLWRSLRQRNEPFWLQSRYYKENAVYIWPAPPDKATDLGKIETEVRDLVSKLEPNLEPKLKRVLVWPRTAIDKSMRNCKQPSEIPDPAGFIVAIMESSEDVEKLVYKSHTCKRGGHHTQPTWAEKPFTIEPLDSGWAPLTVSRVSGQPRRSRMGGSGVARDEGSTGIY